MFDAHEQSETDLFHRAVKNETQRFVDRNLSV